MTSKEEYGSENIARAVSLCEGVSSQLYDDENPNTVYRDVAKGEVQRGRTEEDVLLALQYHLNQELKSHIAENLETDNKNFFFNSDIFTYFDDEKDNLCLILDGESGVHRITEDNYATVKDIVSETIKSVNQRALDNAISKAEFEQIRNAVELCGSIITQESKNLNSAREIFQMTAEQEIESGFTANEILETFGNIACEYLTAYISAEQDKLIDRDEDFKKANVKYSVDKNGLSFILECDGKEYDITENSNVPDMIKKAITDDKSLADIANENIVEAIRLCKEVDFSLNENPEQTAVYEKTARQGLEEGKSEEEILQTLGETIKGTVDSFLKEQENSCNEEYEKTEKEVFADTSLEFAIEDGSLKLFLDCGRYAEYEIREDTLGIKELLVETFIEAENEHSEKLEEDDFNLEG